MIYAVVLRGLGYERKIYGANSGLSLSAVCCGMFILSFQTMYIALDTVEAHSCVDIVTEFTDEQYTSINQSTA